MHPHCERIVVCVDCRRLFQKHFRASLSVCSWKQGVTMSNLTVVTQLFILKDQWSWGSSSTVCMVLLHYM